jgi:hypothetical protein
LLCFVLVHKNLCLAADHIPFLCVLDIGKKRVKKEERKKVEKFKKNCERKKESSVVS